MYRHLKRGFDVGCAMAAGIILSPILAAIALGILVKLGRPVFFRQSRPGLGGKVFILYKFRTMSESRNEQGDPLPDEDRLTKFGNWLRRTSLDELPELWNVIKGEMSLVGPRPLLIEYIPLYSAAQARRHEVRPGITGLAQIKGRNFVPWEERFKLDVWYVEHLSLRLDVWIILQTFRKVFTMEGISGVGRVTMEPFQGNQKAPTARQCTR